MQTDTVHAQNASAASRGPMTAALSPAPPPSGAPSGTPSGTRIGDTALAARLSREIEGEVLFDAFSRGRYSTDASIYQLEPVGGVIPKTERDAEIALQIALDEGVAVLPRGAARRNADRPLA